MFAQKTEAELKSSEGAIKSSEASAEKTPELQMFFTWTQSVYERLEM